MGKVIYSFFFVFLIIFLCQNIYGAPPFITSSTTTTDGILIRQPSFDILKSNEPNTFPIHLFNVSNSAYITNATCFFHLYNQTGNHILTLIQNIPTHDFDFEFQVNGSYLETGSYFINYQCNNTIQKLYGGERYDFIVTKSGTPITISGGLFLSISLIIFMILMITCLMWFNSLQWGHYTNSEGQIVELSKDRIMKVVSFFLFYISALFFSFILNMGSSMFLITNDLSIIFYPIFVILLVGLAPILISSVALIILNTIADSKLQEAIFRGF